MIYNENSIKKEKKIEKNSEFFLKLKKKTLKLKRYTKNLINNL